MRCAFILKSGKQCSRNAKEGSIYCWQHDKIENNNEVKTEIKVESKTSPFNPVNAKSTNSIIKNPQIRQFVQNAISYMISKKDKLTDEAFDLLYQIADYLFYSMKDLKTKEDYINYIEITFIQNPIFKVSITNAKTRALKFVTSTLSGTDKDIINDILYNILSNLSIYGNVSKRTITYFDLNTKIANDPILSMVLGDLIVPIKYTLLSGLSIIPKRVISNKIKSSNLKISEDAIVFIQEYIYWNYKNTNKDVKSAIFGNMDINIKDFFDRWFDIMLPLFSQINHKIEYKEITDLILSNDIFNEYHTKAKNIARNVLVNEISGDVVNNIFNQYL